MPKTIDELADQVVGGYIRGFCFGILLLIAGFIWLYNHSNEGVMAPIPQQPQQQPTHYPPLSLQPNGDLPDPPPPSRYTPPAPPPP